MGFRPDLQAGPGYYTDGTTQAGQSFRATRDASLAVQETNGKWYELLSRGLLFEATTLTAGIAIIVAATTGNHPTLWNPTAAPGYNAQFARLTAARVSGTDAPGAWYWASTIGAGSTIATAGPIATFNYLANPPLNSLVGGTPASDPNMRWAASVCTFTAAPVFYAPVGITMFTGTVAAVIAEISLIIDYDGEMGVAPGSAISLCTQVATSTALYAVGLTYGYSRA